MPLKPSTLRYLDELSERYPALGAQRAAVLAIAEHLIACHRRGGKLLLCGNGGSAADSEHIVGELVKAFVLPRRLPEEHIQRLARIGEEALAARLQQGIAAIALTANSALATAILNDVDPYAVFAQQVYVYGRPGDLLLGLSTSGNSRNVLNALKVARAFGLTTLGLTGEKPAAIDALCDVVIKVPATEPYKVQEFHLPIFHAVCLMAEQELFES